MESQLTIGSFFAKFVAEVVHSLDCTKGDVATLIFWTELILWMPQVSKGRNRLDCDPLCNV